MSETIETIITAFTLGMTGAMAPGPTLVAAVNTSIKYGWKAGPKIAAGHALVETLIFLLIAGGLAMAAQQYSRAIALAGGLALIAFGVLTMKDSKSASLNTAKEQFIGNPYMAGIITSAANPYFWIWWLSIGSAMVMDGLKTSLIMAALFMIGHWGADFGWYTLVSTGMDRNRSILSEVNYQRVLTICGGFMVFFGLYYLSSA